MWAMTVMTGGEFGFRRRFLGGTCLWFGSCDCAVVLGLGLAGSVKTNRI